MSHLVQDIEWLQGKKMRQIHLKANSRRSKHFFSTISINITLLLQDNFFPEWKTLRITLIFLPMIILLPQNEH